MLGYFTKLTHFTVISFYYNYCYYGGGGGGGFQLNKKRKRISNLRDGFFFSPFLTKIFFTKNYEITNNTFICKFIGIFCRMIYRRLILGGVHTRAGSEIL